MATPTADSYSALSGASTVRCGMPDPPAGPVMFDSVVELSTGANAPLWTTAQTLIVSLHGSGNNLTGLTGTRIMSAALNASNPHGAYLTDTEFHWHEQKAGTLYSNTAFRLWPADRQPDNGLNRRESYWLGWTDGPDAGQLRLYTEKRLDAMVERYLTDTRVSATKRVLDGGSMGAWGTMTYGIRRPHIFPAIYPDRPRWRSSVTAGNVTIPSWTVAVAPTYSFAAAPLLCADDGGTSAAAHLNHIDYVANTANAIPWIGWTVGRLDGYMPFQDHIDAVAAMRAAGRGFCFLWNNGNHGTGPSPFSITNSYPYGIFELGKGYPVFSEHSLDQDPSVDLVGGINQNLSFRSVTETTGTWSCQVTNVSAACTVKVKPKSSIYTGNPTPQLVTIPAANSWVTVSF